MQLFNYSLPRVVYKIGNDKLSDSEHTLRGSPSGDSTLSVTSIILRAMVDTLIASSAVPQSF